MTPRLRGGSAWYRRRPRTSTLVLGGIIVLVSWLALRTADEATRLDREVTALRHQVAEQRTRIQSRPDAGEVAALREQVDLLRAALARIAPGGATRVTARFIESAESALAEPIYTVSAVNLFMPHYMRFCASYELAGASYDRCMREPDFTTAWHCYYEELVVGRPLPDCFR